MDSSAAGAATHRLRAWIERHSGTGTVVHAGRDAVYVEVRDRCVGVLARDAVRVPCGIQTTLAALSARPGDRVELASGRLHVAGRAVAVRRTVPVRVIRCADPRRAHSHLRERLVPRIGPVLAELDSGVLAALASGDPDAVSALLGRGSGLTPVGDDVLCGWLATDPGPSAVAAETERLAPTRTTTLSGALLDCARHGEVVPQFARLARSLAGPADPRARAAVVDNALDGLLAVGHTSGAGLALGHLLGLDHRARAS